MNNSTALSAAPNVLLVDDDDIDVMAVKRSLGKAGHGPRIVVAHDGEQALVLLRAANDDADSVRAPCVVLLDINMPRMNGFEFLEQVRRDARLCNLVIFVLSTSDSERDRERAYSYNIAGFINKSRPDGHFEASMSMLADYCNVVELPNAP